MPVAEECAMPTLDVPVAARPNRANVAQRSQPAEAPLKIEPVRLPIRRREKRRHLRVPSDARVTVRYGGIYEALGQAVNLSARGLFFELSRKLAPGSAVELIFRLPRAVVRAGNVWLRCQGEVVRVEEGLPNGRFRVAAKLTTYELFRVS
jgi:hypothetical protein